VQIGESATDRDDPNFVQTFRFFARLKGTEHMEDFTFWLEMGFSHILDWQGYDHMLFLLALCCVFTYSDKRWIWLVSAFTVGHAISLALSVLNVVRLPSAWIEAMIPATIAFSCVQHLWPLVKPGKSVLSDKAILPTVLTFGLIHGLGFSNFLRSMLGSQASIFGPLFSFHVGLELGQVIIILMVLGLTTALDRLFHLSQNQRVTYLASPVLLLSLWMFVERLMTQ
jgi:hypothetical protein